MEYEDKKLEYIERFGLGYIGSDIEKRFVLIGLVCYLTHKAREKNPSTTCLEIVQALNKKFWIEKSLQERIAIISEDFMYGCTKFSTFGVKPSEIINTLKDIIDEMLPF